MSASSVHLKYTLIANRHEWMLVISWKQEQWLSALQQGFMRSSKAASHSSVIRSSETVSTGGFE